MKKALFFILCISSLLWAEGVEFSHRLYLDTWYTSNVLNLSEDDLDEYDAGTNPDKYTLDTSDDLITSARLWLDINHRCIFGHTSIQRIVLKFDKHWSNSDLDGGYIQAKYRQYLSKSVRLMADYFYYPEIYVNRYIPAIVGVDSYKDYTYGKNVWRGTLEWDVIKNLELSYRAEFSQKYYNEYFTEYDASGLEHRLSVTTSLFAPLRLSAYASYETDEADGADAYDSVEMVDQVKDASYDQNQFGMSLNAPLARKWRVSLSADYQMRFYQSDVAGDTYHLGRDDYRTDLRVQITAPRLKKIQIQPYWHVQKREVSSPFAQVKADKEYLAHEVGVSILFR
jgi:hypothetical protein